MRVLICDNHKPLVAALTMALTDNGQTVVATALDPDGAVAAALEHQPDACLLDLNFPRHSGLNAIARIRAVSPGTKVVMLSGSITTDLVAEAIAEGAQGFVGKEKAIGVIVEALEQASRGNLAVDPVFLPAAQQPRRVQADPLTVLQHLTDPEWRLMRCLMDGLSIQQTATELGVPVTAARAGVARLLAQFGVNSLQQIAGLMKASV